MAEDRALELPEHIVTKIQKVLGVSPTSLTTHELVSLIEDLCDTALMFDREERGAEQAEEEKPTEEIAAATTAPTAAPSTTSPPKPLSVASIPVLDSGANDPGSTAAVSEGS